MVDYTATKSHKCPRSDREKQTNKQTKQNKAKQTKNLTKKKPKQEQGTHHLL